MFYITEQRTAWTQNLIILTQSKRPEEQEFYLRMAIWERWGKRELEKQFRQALFERTVLHPPKVSPVVRQIHGEEANSIFKDSYFFEFLDLPVPHTEDNLHYGGSCCLGHLCTQSSVRRSAAQRYGFADA
jgi:predicted nuclease of restriction endonuclease-like (RecB) superfamily